MRLLLALAALLGVAESRAAVVDVFPGPGTPLQDAIDAAAPGDTLYVHNGTYGESITITKSLRVHARDGAVTIQAGCAAAAAVTVAADDVLIRGDQRLGTLLIIEGGAVSVVDVQNRGRITIKDTVYLNGACAGVQYGLNVSNSTDVRVMDVRTFAVPETFADAGFRVGTIPVGGRVTVSKSFAGAATRGILVEDCPFGSRVMLRRNVIGNEVVTDGIVLSDSDGVRILRNEFSFNTVLGVGISLDATSDDNRVTGNQFVPTGGPNASDNGTSNCWLRNNCADATCPGPDGCP